MILFSELIKNLSNLRSVLDADNGDEAEREFKIYDYMDKHNCDRDVAEIPSPGLGGTRLTGSGVAISQREERNT